MPRKKLELNSKNIFCVQMFSLRDKETGKYLIDMDGNVKQTINHLFNNDVESVIMTIPFNVERFRVMNLETFIREAGGVKDVSFVSLDYGENASVARTNIIEIFNSDDYILSEIMNESGQVLCDFPVDIKHNNIIYNFSLTKMSDDDNEPWTKYFDKECELSKTHTVHVLNDQQMYYFNEKGYVVNRSIEIFSKTVTQRINTIIVMNRHDLNVDVLIADVFNDNNNITLCSFRLDDPRYKFEEVVRRTAELNHGLVCDNPTEADEKTIAKCMKICDFYNVPYYIISKESINKTELYSELLCNHSDKFKIIHLEDDFHTATAEQYLLCKDSLIMNKKLEEKIKTYINDK